jgi:hypothetical protein
MRDEQLTHSPLRVPFIGGYRRRVAQLALRSPPKLTGEFGDDNDSGSHRLPALCPRVGHLLLPLIALTL